MPKLSPTQIEALRNLRDHGQPTFGFRSKSAQRTRDSLVRYGLMIEARHPRELPTLTDAGRAMLAKIDGK